MERWWVIKDLSKTFKIRITSYEKDETENWFSSMHTYGQ